MILMKHGLLNFIRTYLPIVLLTLWVALTCVWKVPWLKEKANDEEPTMHEVLLLSSGQDKPRSIAYEAQLYLPLREGKEGCPELMLYFAKDTLARYQAGDVVLLRTQLEEGRGYVPKGCSARLEHLKTSEMPWKVRLRYVSLRAREGLENRLERWITDEENLALTESLLLGDRRRLQPDQRNAFADAGAMHVLAVSGLHVGIILGIVMWLVTCGGLLVIRWEKYHLRRLQRLLALVLIWGYAFLTGMSVSVMRSALMFSFLPLGSLHKETKLRYNRLAAAALIILVIDPSAIGSPSFLLSFGAVLSIMYYYPRWRRLWPYREYTDEVRKRMLQLFYFVRDLLLVSLAAQIGTLPFTLLFFGQSANWFALTNIIILPLAQIALMPLGIAALASSFLPLEWLTESLMWLTDKAAWLMNGSVRWVQSLPGATTYITVTPLMTVLMIAAIVCLTVSIRLKGWKKWTAMALGAGCLMGLLLVYNAVL